METLQRHLKTLVKGFQKVLWRKQAGTWSSYTEQSVEIRFFFVWQGHDQYQTRLEKVRHLFRIEAFVKEMMPHIDWICKELDLLKHKNHQSKSIGNALWYSCNF